MTTEEELEDLASQGKCIAYFDSYNEERSLVESTCDDINVSGLEDSLAEEMEFAKEYRRENHPSTWKLSEGEYARRMLEFNILILGVL